MLDRITIHETRGDNENITISKPEISFVVKMKLIIIIKKTCDIFCIFMFNKHKLDKVYRYYRVLHLTQTTVIISLHVCVCLLCLF